MPCCIAIRRLAFVTALTSLAMLTPSWGDDPSTISTGQSAGVEVVVVSATRKSLPVRLDFPGVVTPIVSVAVRSRLESAIREVHFEDGADVRTGDLLFTLDDRLIRVEIRRVQAILAAEKARLEQAERDVLRSAELVGRNAGTAVGLANARTQVAILRAAVEASEATLEKLHVELEFTKISAPISGRITASLGRAGNLTRFSDSLSLATIVQMDPVHVTFTVPQHDLPSLRRAMRERSDVEFVVAPENRTARGRIVMIDDYTVPNAGLTTVRAVVTGERDGLWPHMLVTVNLPVRHEEAVVVPSSAIRTDLAGAYVFVVEAGRARSRRIKIARIVDGQAILAEGLHGDESVVTGDHLRLAENMRIALHPVDSRI